MVVEEMELNDSFLICLSLTLSVKPGLFFFLTHSNHIKRYFPELEGTRPTPRYYHASLVLDKGSEFVIFGGIRPKEFLYKIFEPHEFD